MALENFFKIKNKHESEKINSNSIEKVLEKENKQELIGDCLHLFCEFIKM
jgi:hypothetical protein